MSSQLCALTAQRCAALLSYDPAAGTFTWLTAAGTATKGKPAGCMDRTGYIRIGIDGQRHAAHRLAYLLMNGQHPSQHIDHINGNRADNRWANLREATRTDNNRNKANRSDNTSGHPGVTWMPRNKKWRARINAGSQRISLGLFASRQQAIAARKKAEAQHGYQPNHGRAAV